MARFGPKKCKTCSGTNGVPEQVQLFQGLRPARIGQGRRLETSLPAGEPVSIKWDRRSCVFGYRFNADGGIAAPTVIYLPPESFGPGTKVVTDLRFELDLGELRLFLFNDGRSGPAEVSVTGGKVKVIDNTKYGKAYATVIKTIAAF